MEEDGGEGDEGKVEALQPAPALEHHEEAGPQGDVDEQDPEHQHHRHLQSPPAHSHDTSPDLR